MRTKPGNHRRGVVGAPKGHTAAPYGGIVPPADPTDPGKHRNPSLPESRNPYLLGFHKLQLSEFLLAFL